MGISHVVHREDEYDLVLVDVLADLLVQALVVFSAGAFVGFCQGDDFRSFAGGHLSSIICSSFSKG